MRVLTFITSPLGMYVACLYENDYLHNLLYFIKLKMCVLLIAQLNAGIMKIGHVNRLTSSDR